MKFNIIISAPAYYNLIYYKILMVKTCTVSMTTVLMILQYQMSFQMIHCKNDSIILLLSTTLYNERASITQVRNEMWCLQNHFLYFSLLLLYFHLPREVHKIPEIMIID